MKTKKWARVPRRMHAAMAAPTIISMTVGPVVPVFAQVVSTTGRDTTTRIEHIMLIIGENRTFDHVFATYHPKVGVRFQQR